MTTYHPVRAREAPCTSHREESARETKSRPPYPLLGVLLQLSEQHLGRFRQHVRRTLIHIEEVGLLGRLGDRGARPRGARPRGARPRPTQRTGGRGSSCADGTAINVLLRRVGATFGNQNVGATLALLGERGSGHLEDGRESPSVDFVSWRRGGSASARKRGGIASGGKRGAARVRRDEGVGVSTQPGGAFLRNVSLGEPPRPGPGRKRKADFYGCMPCVYSICNHVLGCA